MFARKLGLPTLSMNILFTKPAVYGDVPTFNVHVRNGGRSSLDLETGVTVGPDVIWTIRQKIVPALLENHKSTPWPDDIRAGLDRYLEPVAAE